MFVDRVKIHVKGGDGGKGGNVVFVGESGMSTLMDFRYKRKFVATPGEPGGKRNCFGKDGEDIIIKVPVGTVIREAESGKVMADITTAGEEKILIHGGKGGKGNQHFATPTDAQHFFLLSKHFLQRMLLIVRLKFSCSVRFNIV